MKLCLHTKLKKITPVLSPRPTGGFFIKCTFPEKTYAGLTKVNNPCANGLFSIICNTPVLSDIMPSFTIVNKMARVLYIILGYRLTLSHHLFNFNFFELPLRLGRQARFLYVENADAFSTIQKNRKLASSHNFWVFTFVPIAIGICNNKKICHATLPSNQY